MVMILLAFILNVFSKVNSSDNSFLIMNLVGSMSMMIYAVLIGSIPSLILNGVWAICAAWGLIHHTRKRKSKTEREIVVRGGE